MKSRLALTHDRRHCVAAAGLRAFIASSSPRGTAAGLALGMHRSAGVPH